MMVGRRLSSSYRFPRRHARHKIRPAHHESPVHQHVDNPVRILRRLLECGAIDDPLWIEHHDVRIGARLQATFALHVRIDALEPARREQRHFSHSVHQRDHPALSHESPEDARVRPGGPWVADRYTILKLEPAVARHHDMRIAVSLVRGNLGDREDYHESTLLAVALEALRCQSLSSCSPENVLVADALLFLEPGIEDRAL